MQHVKDVLSADLHAETKENLTALYLVSMTDGVDFPKILVYYGGNILAPTANKKGDYLIHVASTCDSETVLRWILDLGMSVNIPNAEGITPLINKETP